MTNQRLIYVLQSSKIHIMYLYDVATSADVKISEEIRDIILNNINDAIEELKEEENKCQE